MKLFIPEIATKFVITEPWTFSLYSESRNEDFISTLRSNRYSIPKRKMNGVGYYGFEAQRLCDFTLPVGTQLSVSRVYIRRGASEYSSVSFTINFEKFSKTLDKNVKIKGRFWAKLDDVNKLNVDLIT